MVMTRIGEKDILIIGAPVQAPTRRPFRSSQTLRSKCQWTAVGFVVALLAGSIFAMAFFSHDYLLQVNSELLSAGLLLGHTGNSGGGTVTATKLCPQSDAFYPESHAQLWVSLGRDFDDNDASMTRGVTWLGGAVRIPYVVFIFIECHVLMLCDIFVLWDSHCNAERT